MKITRRALLSASGVAATASLAGCWSSSPPPEVEGTWPRRGVDNAHTGFVDADPPTESLSASWEQSPQADRVVSPVVGGDRVYVAHSHYEKARDPGVVRVKAFDAGGGESLWTADPAEATWNSAESPFLDSLVLDGDRLFLQTQRGLQTVGTDGELGWTFSNLGPWDLHSGSPPVVTDDVAVTSTYGTTADGPETVYGVDPAEGTEVWHTDLPSFSDPRWLAAADGVAYAASMRDGVVALDLESGDELWRRSLSAMGQITVSGGRVVVGIKTAAGGTDEVVALDASNGDEQWRRETGFLWPQNGFAVADGTVYHAAALRLVARSLETGEREWRFPATEGGERAVKAGATPALTPDAAFVVGTAGPEDGDRLFTVDRETGDRLGAYDTGPLSDALVPAVTGELVFLSDPAVAALE